jgi:hypothetical protein
MGRRREFPVGWHEAETSLPVRSGLLFSTKHTGFQWAL